MNLKQTQPTPARKQDKFTRALAAILLATVFNHFADRLLDAHIEIFTGITYFSPSWIIDMFLVPFIAGYIVSSIYGFGGKWLSLAPSVLVRCISYFEAAQFTFIPKGSHLLPLGWWALFVFLVSQSALLGGIIGEIMNKKAYGRSPKNLVHKNGKPTDKTDQVV